uniref:Uncharacterized protein n=1 Tax=Opuntia streptacantha TaxID=393608 RepID=A0A7C9CRY4_OPUST
MTRVSLAGKVRESAPSDLTAGIWRPGSSVSSITFSSCSTTALAAGELVLNADLLISAFNSAAKVISMTAMRQFLCNSPVSFSINLAKQSSPFVSLMLLLLERLSLASIHSALEQLVLSSFFTSALSFSLSLLFCTPLLLDPSECNDGDDNDDNNWGFKFLPLSSLSLLIPTTEWKLSNLLGANSPSNVSNESRDTKGLITFSLANSSFASESCSAMVATKFETLI